MTKLTRKKLEEQTEAAAKKPGVPGYLWRDYGQGLQAAGRSRATTTRAFAKAMLRLMDVLGTNALAQEKGYIVGVDVHLEYPRGYPRELRPQPIAVFTHNGRPVAYRRTKGMLASGCLRAKKGYYEVEHFSKCLPQIEDED